MTKSPPLSVNHFVRFPVFAFQIERDQQFNNKIASHQGECQVEYFMKVCIDQNALWFCRVYDGLGIQDILRH
jgi:hypothetical protein